MLTLEAEYGNAPAMRYRKILLVVSITCIYNNTVVSHSYIFGVPHEVKVMAGKCSIRKNESYAIKYTIA